MSNLLFWIKFWSIWAHSPANDNWPVSDEIAQNLGLLLKKAA
jgi:hypothetical protein